MPSSLQTNPNRQSNIELLRIVTMFMIVAGHFALYSHFYFPAGTFPFNQIWIQFLLISGKIGPNLFILISGYFLITQDTVKTDKLVKLWAQILFYSVAIFFLFTVTGAIPFRITTFIKHLAPITYGEWWFVSAYFVLYLFSPYLNRLLRTLSRKQYSGFLILLTFIWSVIPTVTGEKFQSNNLLWFIFLYALAGYIRLFNVKTHLSSATLFKLSALFLLLTVFCIALLNYFGIRLLDNFFGSRQTLPVFIPSVMLFLGFLKLKIGYNRFINLFASTMFGIYLIHDNEYVRSFLWNKAFRSYVFADSHLLIPYSLILIILVFLSCAFIELARKYLLGKNIVPSLNKLAAWIDTTKDSFFADKRIGK